jgi:hypothetical protein
MADNILCQKMKKCAPLKNEILKDEWNPTGDIIITFKMNVVTDEL